MGEEHGHERAVALPPEVRDDTDNAFDLDTHAGLFLGLAQAGGEVVLVPLETARGQKPESRPGDVGRALAEEDTIVLHDDDGYGRSGMVVGHEAALGTDEAHLAVAQLLLELCGAMGTVSGPK